jgi:hypothetical protein
MFNKLLETPVWLLLSFLLALGLMLVIDALSEEPSTSVIPSILWVN